MNIIMTNVINYIYNLLLIKLTYENTFQFIIFNNSAVFHYKDEKCNMKL